MIPGILSRKVLKYTNAIIVCDGNSITAAAYPGQAYPTTFAATWPFSAPGNNVYNYGVSSQQTSQMIADAATQIDSHVASGRPVIVIAWELTNSIYYGSTAQQAADAMATYCTGRKTAGAKRVVVVTALPRNGVTQANDNATVYNSRIDTCNAIVRQNWKTYADAIVDVREIPEFATNPVSTAYMPDGVHLNEAGFGLFVPKLATVLKRLAA